MKPARLQVWLVSPAYGRFAVTRLALAQRAHLAGELAGRGIDCHTVIVADDDNLDIAREHGFHTVELDNNHGLGRRFNAGFQYAAAQGADYLVHIGSDDWLHPDTFALLGTLTPRQIVAGRMIAFIDLLTGKLRPALLLGPTGVIPWIIPRALMERCGFAPIRPERYRGMDGFLVRGLRQAGARVEWVFHDPNPVARVDFKSATNINTYAGLPSGLGHESDRDPWEALAEHYPPHLVELAHRAHLEEVFVPKLRNPNGRIVSVSRQGIDVLLKRGYTRLDTPVADEPPAPTIAVADEPPAPARPSVAAAKAEWVEYARAQGVDDPDTLTKAQLVETAGHVVATGEAG